MKTKQYAIWNSRGTILISLMVLVGMLLFTGCEANNEPIDLSLLKSSSDSSDLIVEEYELVDVETDSPTHMEFTQWLTPDMIHKRAVWKNLTPDRAVQDINTVLSKYGYSIEHEPMLSSYTYRLLENYAILLNDIYPVGIATENQDQDNFALLVQNYEGDSYLLQKSGLQEWQPGRVYTYTPVYYQNELVYPVIHYTSQVASEFGDSTIQIVSESGEVIYETSLPSNPVMAPIQSFQSWNNHWILEKEGEVIMDGKSLNEEFGFDEIFEWRIIQGEPFFFVYDDESSTYSMVYAGKLLDQSYDDIAHYQCCEPAMFNPDGTGYMTWFYAVRDGKWYYVEAGIYPAFEK